MQVLKLDPLRFTLVPVHRRLSGSIFVMLAFGIDVMRQL
jgi:hypothetical protein